MRTLFIITLIVLWISITVNFVLILFTLPHRERTIMFLTKKIRELFHKKFNDLNHDELIELYKKLDNDTALPEKNEPVE